MRPDEPAPGVIHALGDGYDVYFVTDASGGVSLEAHEVAIQLGPREDRAGTRPYRHRSPRQHRHVVPLGTAASDARQLKEASRG